jgi:hypothetical protein
MKAGVLAVRELNDRMNIPKKTLRWAEKLSATITASELAS